MESSEFLSDGAQTAARPDIEVLDFPVQRGSMCEVCRVRQYGKLLLMKRLLPHHADTPQYQQALRKEFETGYLLEHPNLVRYMGWGEDDKGPFLLQEYVDGKTLGEFLAENRGYFDNQDNEQKFITQILSVLGFLHSHQVVHLDLKPDNILITRIGQEVKLIDLGCCYSDTFADTAGLNRDFAAPEQLHSSERFQPAPQTDLYALGKVLEWLAMKKGCRLTKAAHRLTKALLKARVEDRPQSADDALLLYQQRPGSLRYAIIALAGVSIVALYLFATRTKDNAVMTDVLTEAPTIVEAVDTIEAIVDSKPKPATAELSVREDTPSQTSQLECEQEEDTIVYSTPTCKIYDLETVRKFIAEDIDDGRPETRRFIYEVDSMLQDFYSKLSEKYTPLTLDNYNEYISRRIDFGFEFRHFVEEASSRNGISSSVTYGVSQSLYEARESFESDRLFLFLDKNGLVKE